MHSKSIKDATWLKIEATLVRFNTYRPRPNSLMPGEATRYVNHKLPTKALSSCLWRFNLKILLNFIGKNIGWEENLVKIQ